MALERRVTLRCLTEDLSADWDEVDHYRAAKALRAVVAQRVSEDARDSDVARHLRAMPRLNRLSHPLIRQFDGSFSPDSLDSARESISGLANPHWWKQKIMQWRGAATDHSTVGSDAVWLCAAGIRRSGSRDDFYAVFLRDIGRAGAESLLPQIEDREVERIDGNVLALDAWKLQVHCGILGLLAGSIKQPGTTHTFQFPKPALGAGLPAIGKLTLSVEVIESDGSELVEGFLNAVVLDYANVKAVDVATQIARAALQTDAEGWRSTTYGADSFAFSAVLDPVSLSHANQLASTGILPEDCTPGNLRLGLRAHYAVEHGLVDAQVDGSSVLSLCGYWFVPTVDHENLETCSECQNRHESLSAT